MVDAIEPNFTFKIINKDIPPPPQCIIKKDDNKDFMTEQDLLNQLHMLLDKIYEYSKTWDVDWNKFDTSELIIKNMHEYQAITHFRKLQKLHAEQLTKDVIDTLIVGFTGGITACDEDTLFINRNKGKEPNKEMKSDVMKHKQKRKFNIFK